MNRNLVFLLLLSIVVGIGFLHLFTPAEMMYHHQTYRRLSYFPIVLGAIWFGVRGGLVLALLASIAFVPHVLLFAGSGLSSYFGELSEIVLYCAAGGLVGAIAGRERRLRERYQRLSVELEDSYVALATGAHQLVEAEEHLAAARKLTALGEMAATLAHEVKNPLASIKGTAEILLDDYPAGHPKREFVEILIKETARLAAAVEDVLGRVRDKQSHEGQQTIALSRLIDELQTQMKPQFDACSITCEVVGLDRVGAMTVPEPQLRQVLLNLLVNGCDALARQAGAPRRIRLACTKQRQGLMLTVDDNGPGVAAGHRDDAFKPFYTTTKGGTGLGLSISRRIMERYGGSLELCDSQLGGACFAVALPQGFERSWYGALIGGGDS